MEHFVHRLVPHPAGQERKQALGTRDGVFPVHGRGPLVVLDTQRRPVLAELVLGRRNERPACGRIAAATDAPAAVAVDPCSNGRRNTALSPVVGARPRYRGAHALRKTVAVARTHAAGFRATRPPASQRHDDVVASRRKHLDHPQGAGPVQPSGSRHGSIRADISRRTRRFDLPHRTRRRFPGPSRSSRSASRAESTRDLRRSTSPRQKGAVHRWNSARVHWSS